MPSRRFGALAAGALVALLLAAAGASLRAHWAADLWSQRFDYAPLTLGQALNHEMAARGALPRPVTYYQLYHPGLPFQLASWMALRFTADAADGPLEMGMKALRDPSGFWRGAGIAVALLTLAGLLALVAASRALPPLAVAAVLASYFCLDSSWTSGFLFLTNDSFALPAGVALLLLARQIFAADEPRWGLLAAAGCVGGVAYLSKLPYVIWSVSFGAGLLVRLLSAPRGSRLAWVGAGVVYGAGWLAAFAALTSLLMTPEAVSEMLRLHFDTATHSGYHSTGAGSVSNLATLGFGLVRLSDHPLFLSMLALLAAALAAVLGRSGGREHARSWPVAAMVVVNTLLVLAAVVKHYKVYYLLVALAFVPPALAWCLAELPAAWRSRLSFAALALCAASFASQFVRPPMDMTHWSRYVPWRGADAEIAAIEALPLESGQVRAWSYGCTGPGYYRQFAAAISGYAPLLEQVRREFPQDRSTDDALPDWRYAIYEWNLVDPAEEDPASVALFAGMRAEVQARLAQGEALPRFKRYLVIERRTHGSLPGLARSGEAARTRP